MDWIDGAQLALLAFVLEVADASLGMGYGTILTPVLLMLGYKPLTVVPAVIASQLVGQVAAVFSHHMLDNINLAPGNRETKVGVILSALGVLGTVAAVVLALNISERTLNLYVAAQVIAVGAGVLFIKPKERDFSWTRLTLIGLLASFNKGLSGGGYGPVVTAGQLITGVEASTAVAITTLSEASASLVALLAYLLLDRNVDWQFVLPLAIGVVLSAPMAAIVVEKFEEEKLRGVIGLGTIALGLVTLLRVTGVL
jgi:hypothetical protein